MATFIKHGLYRRDPAITVTLPDAVTQPELADHFRQMSAASLEVAERLNGHDPRLDVTLIEKISSLISNFAMVSSELDHFAALLDGEMIPMAKLDALTPEAYALMLDHQRRALCLVLSRIAYAAEKFGEAPIREDGRGLSAYKLLIQLMRRAKRLATDFASVIAYRRPKTEAEMAEEIHRLLMEGIVEREPDPMDDEVPDARATMTDDVPAMLRAYEEKKRLAKLAALEAAAAATPSPLGEGVGG